MGKIKSFALFSWLAQLILLVGISVPVMVVTPTFIKPAHALQCAGFNLVQTVLTNFVSVTYTFNAGRQITFNFNLQPGGSASISFLGVTESRTNTGGTTQPYSITFTVPNTGPTSSGSFIFDVLAGAAVTFNGSCAAGPALPPATQININDAINNVDGTLFATNPEAFNGDVFSLFFGSSISPIPGVQNSPFSFATPPPDNPEAGNVQLTCRRD